jgi:hypothetical protein
MSNANESLDPADSDHANGAADETRRTLISWNDVSLALDDLIAHATRTIDVFDHSLALQDWGSKARCEALQRAAFDRHVHVRILLVDLAYVTTQAPRLINLLKTLGHRIEIVGSDARGLPPSSFAVADRQHFLFRPDSVHSRGRLNLQSPAKSIPYANDFEVLWEQGGQRVFPEALGL